MQDAETIIKVFTTRVRQLILKVGELKKSNQELSDIISKRDEQIMQLNEQIARMSKDYDTMMMAKMLSVTDNNIDDTKRRINKLIASVDRCITLLGKTQEK